MTSPAQTTQTIAGHALTLTAGRRYLASRPFAARGCRAFPIEVHDVTNGAGCWNAFAHPVLTLPAMEYAEANRFLAAFNCDGSFDGRTW